MAAPHPDFVKQVVVDITPSAEGQENLLAMFAGSIRDDRPQRLVLDTGHYEDNAQRWMLDYYERANLAGTSD